MTTTINSYFSGGGLLDIGLLQAGIKIGASYELDPTCCAVQAANLGGHVRQADISGKLVEGDQGADGMVFTYPCTKYSTIADIHGTRTGDDLFLHALRHLAIARPEVYAVENVPGMRAFPVVMEAMTRMPDYYVQVFCPVKSSDWLPQRRDRLIIIGSRKRFAWRAPERTRPVALADILEQDPQITIPAAVARRMQGGYRDRPIVSDPARGDIAPTCVAHYAKDKSTRLVADKRFPLGVRPYSVREYARLQGVPDDYRFNCSETAAYRMIGNGVSVPVGRWLGGEFRRYFARHTSPKHAISQHSNEPNPPERVNIPMDDVDMVGFSMIHVEDPQVGGGSNCRVASTRHVHHYEVEELDASPQIDFSPTVIV